MYIVVTFPPPRIVTNGELITIFRYCPAMCATYKADNTLCDGGTVGSRDWPTCALVLKALRPWELQSLHFLRHHQNY